MLFCLGEGSSELKGAGYHKAYQAFNQQLTEEEYKKVKNQLPTIEIPVTRWIKDSDMTKEEKKNVSGWSEMGGYLKYLGYEEGWKVWWAEASKEDKEKILNCKYFDKVIFQSITGLEDFQTISLSGKKVSVELDGKKYTATID